MSPSATARPLVLVHGSDVDFYLMLDHILQREGIASELLAREDDATKVRLEASRPAALLLDWRSHQARPSETCRVLRCRLGVPQLPVVALVNQGADQDYVDLVKAGVKDIFVRPVLPAKLLECLSARLASSSEATARKAKDAIHYADLEVNLSAYRVRRGDRDVHLSPIEFRLLRHLIEHPEQVATREELKNAAWQQNIHVGPRTVDVHMGRLRKALRCHADSDLIRTVRSVGYALSAGDVDDDAPPEAPPS